MPDKALIWLGSSLRDVQGFPALARRLAGFQLRRVQQGLDPDDWKPMRTVGPGVREIRIYGAGAHRVFYVTTRPERWPWSRRSSASDGSAITASAYGIGGMSSYRSRASSTPYFFTTAADL